MGVRDKFFNIWKQLDLKKNHPTVRLPIPSKLFTALFTLYSPCSQRRGKGVEMCR